MIKKEIERIMENPDRKYAIYPIIHPRISNFEIAEEMEECGFAGVVGNIKYGRDFQNNKACWDDAEAGFRKYKELGMYTWLYDEDGYPSGSAGGYLCEDYPEHIAKGLYCYQSWRPLPGSGEYRASIPDGELWRAVLLSWDGKEILDITDTKNENNVLYFDRPDNGGGWWLIVLFKRRIFDGAHQSESYASARDYINLTDRAATEKFIEMTHENYKKRLSDEFGKSIRATFTDEPSLVSWYCDGGIYPVLTWQDDFPEKFYNRYGYDILEAIIALLKQPDKVNKRCDYWEFIADLTVEGYFKPIQEWCHKNNLKASGHLLAEERLSLHVLAYGSFYRSMKYFDWPGIDQLHTQPELQIDERHIPFARMVASFADISGENEVFTEFSDHSLRAKKVVEKELYYGSVNWHLAMGINNFTSYYSFNGFEKEDKIALNQYTARMSEIMRMGVRDSDTAVLYPECDMWSLFNMNKNKAWFNGGAEFMKLHDRFAKLTWRLLYKMVDYDHIDDEIIVDGKIENGYLCYKNRCYKNLVIPSGYVLRDDTAKRIAELAENGISVYALGNVSRISRESGEKSAYAEKFDKLVASGKIYANDDIDALVKNFEGGLLRTKNQHKSLMAHCRKLDDGTRIVLVSNTSYEAISDSLTVREKCSKIYKVDGEKQTIEDVDFAETAEGVSFEIGVGALKAQIYILE